MPRAPESPPAGSGSASRHSVAARIRRGLAWNAAGLFLSRGASILVRLLLAGVLLPQHFGWAAMIAILTGLAVAMVDLGLPQVLIQRPRDRSSRLLHDTAFWAVLASGLAWTVLLAAAGAPGLVWYFGEPALLAPTMVMAITVIVQAATLYPTVVLTRRMRFRPMVTAEAAGVVAGSVVALVLAYAGAGVWSLVLQALLSGAVTCGWLWWACRSRPRRRFDVALLRSALPASTAVLGARAIQFLRTQLDKLFVGTTLGAVALGLYSLAYMLAEGLRAQVAAIIGRVLLPAFSQAQQDPSAMRALYLSALRMWTFTLLPACLAVALFAPALVRTLLDPEWQAVSEPLGILAFSGVAYALSGPCAEVLQALGKPGQLLRIAWLNLLIVALPATWWLTGQHGIVGTSLALTVAFALQRVATAVAAWRSLGLSASLPLSKLGPGMAVAVGLVAGHMLWGSKVALPLQLLVFAAAFGVLAGLSRRRTGQ